MNGTAIALLVVIALLVALCVSFAVVSLQNVRTVVDHASAMHERTMTLLQDTQDRFMAVDFASYKAQKAFESATPGGYEDPEPVKTAEQMILEDILRLESKGG